MDVVVHMPLIPPVNWTRFWKQMSAGRIFPPGRFDYVDPLPSRLGPIAPVRRTHPIPAAICRNPIRWRRALESSEHSVRRASVLPAQLRPAGAGRAAPRGQGLCLGTLVRLVYCRVRLAVPAQRRRGGVWAERSPCNAAARHQRIPLPARHGRGPCPGGGCSR